MAKTSMVIIVEEGKQPLLSTNHELHSLIWFYLGLKLSRVGHSERGVCNLEREESQMVQVETEL